MAIPLPQRSEYDSLGGHVQTHGKGFGAKKALQIEKKKRDFHVGVGKILRRKDNCKLNKSHLHQLLLEQQLDDFLEEWQETCNSFKICIG